MLQNTHVTKNVPFREPRDPEDILLAQTIESEPISGPPIPIQAVNNTQNTGTTGNFVEVPGDTMTGTLNFSSTADPAISGDQFDYAS